MSKSETGFALFIAIIIGFFAGVIFDAHYFRDAAVRKGHAEYYLDKDFKRQWRWKP